MLLRTQDGKQSLNHSLKERCIGCSQHASQGLAFIYSDARSMASI